MTHTPNEILAREFSYWFGSLEQSITDVTAALVAPINEEQLADVFTDMQIAEKKLEALRPTVKKIYSYNFEPAVALLGSATKLTGRVGRVLKLSKTPPESPHQHREHSQMEFKLPKLDIPKFYGDFSKYHEFKQMFDYAIHNAKLSHIQKFTYLKMHVKGDAEKKISGFPMTEDGYKLAYNFLEESYGDKKLLIQQLYDKLKSVPKATKLLPSITQTYEALEPPLRMLSELDEDIDGSLLLYNLIVQKYDQETLIPLRQSISNVTELQQAIGGIVLFSKKIQPTTLNAKIESSGTTTAALAVVTTPSESKNTSNHHHSSKNASTPRNMPRKCPFCAKDGHWADECPDFKTVTERKHQIKGACFLCLRSNHIQKDCRSMISCAHCKEAKKHHRSLCPKKFGYPERPKTQSQFNDRQPVNEDTNGAASVTNAPTTAKTNTSATTILTAGEQGTFLTLMATVRNPISGEEQSCRVILDSCSTHTYVLESTMKLLQLPRLKEDIFNITKFQGESQTMRTAETEFQLVSPDGVIIPIQANTTPAIIDTVSTINVNTFRQKNPQFNIKYADNGEGEPIQIMIGSDYFCKILTFQHIEVNNEIDLMGTKFGWLIAGRVKKQDHTSSVLLTTVQGIERLWSLDQIGISTDLLTEEENERKALQNFYENIEEKDGRYQVTWPWKQYPPDLPDNYGLALGRLRSLFRTYENEPEILQKYDAILREQERAGIIEQVPDEELCTNNPTHYLPHHPIINENKSTSLRGVFDGSAKSSKKNRSLNECIFKGKLFLIHIAKILMRVRIRIIVILADVEKAFHQIQLKPQDRDVVRFIWVIDINKLFSLANIKIFRFCRTPFGIIASLFLLLATIYYHFITKNPKYLAIVQKDMYSDNVATGANDVKEAIAIYVNLKTEFKKMSMNLRKWVTNNPEVEEKIAEEDRDTSPVINILGITWDKVSDVLYIRPTTIKTNVITKRTVLSKINAVFDPLGFAAPILLPAKLLLKKITDDKFEWDDELPSTITDEWITIHQELELIADIKIPRYVSVTGNVSLHCFVDASVSAFGVAVYIRSETNEVKTALVFAKSRITPGRNLSVPKLELIAVVLGIRCLKFTIDALDLPTMIEKYIWSDARCVLSWIETTKMLPIFVTRRIEEIRTLKDVKFRYVPTAENTADIATRGMPVSTLKLSNWFSGPTWLSQTEQNWPKQPILTQYEPEKTESTAPVLLIVANDTATPFGIDPKRFSSFNKLINVTVIVIRAVFKLLRKFSGEKFLQNPPEPLYPYAEKLWIKSEQQKVYATEIVTLQKNKSTSLIKDLNLYLDDDNIIRTRGRYQNAPLTEGTKNPILLPPRKQGNVFLELLIHQTHMNNFHAGVAYTLAAIRKRFWIPQGRRAVFETLRKSCRKCVRFNTAPFKIQDIASLPESRFDSLELPFTYVGIDLFGPLNVKKWINNSETVQKRYGLIITCIVIRAIHIEVLETITTNEILLALRRFVARRTTPKFILSDNAKQFILADKIFHTVLQSQLNQPNSSIARFLTEHAITWKFVPNYAPWQGGIYERLIGIIKNSLKRTFRNYLLSDKMLSTVIIEIEASINARPLTYVGAESDVKILRPSDFLQKKFPPTLLVNMEENVSTRASNTQESIVKKWKRSEKLLDQLWALWKHQYILSLRERKNQLNIPRNSTPRIPKTGEIVLLALPHLKRNDWQIVEINKLLESHDGLIRTAQVRFASGRTAEYAINHLAPLELHVEDSPIAPEPEKPIDDHHEESDFEIDEIEVVQVESESSDFEIDEISVSEINE